MTPTLNWREISLLVDRMRSELQGQSVYVDRIVVPSREEFPSGYVKGEWAIRLNTRKEELTLLFSVRPRHPYVTLSRGKGPRAAPQGTHSPFDLALSKHLKGGRVLGIEALARERIVVLWITSEGTADTEENLGLVITLMPATPEALLVRREIPQGAQDYTAESWPILTRSRITRTNENPDARFTPPTGAQAPADPEVREELIRDSETFHREIERGLLREAFELRLKAAEKEIRDLLKQARTRARQSEVAMKEAESEPDWRHYGDLLKSSLGSPPPLLDVKVGGKVLPVRTLLDYATDQYVNVPCDPKLGPQAQVEKFYTLARRKGRRFEEARARLSGFRETIERLEALLAAPPAFDEARPSDGWKSLERFERAAGIHRAPPSSAGTREKKPKNAWLGKTFVSKDGLPILVGRNRTENLELTFKVARGNDVWLHVRGKPSSHALIPLHSGKSAPLETLLDAANLLLHYSGGEKWGKTEVDYTFKKYVKRIKDSTEASYTNNKTLIVELEAARVKRLLGSAQE